MADIEKTELFKRFSGARNLPYVSLATLPTPLETIEIDAPFQLTVKRDDLTASEYGGNKVRKLEFLLGDAIANGKSEVWTVGAIGSHHVLATCIFAEKLGLDRGALHFPQPVTEHVKKNMLALSTTHPKLNLLSTKFGLPAEILKQKISEWLNLNPDVYYIPGGGSNGLGAIGYVNAGLEFASQIEGSSDRPDAIFVAAGTCGTMSGLLVGLKLAELDIPVFGVRVVDRIVANEAIVRGLASRTCERLRRCNIPIKFGLSDDVNLVHDALGEDYGVPTARGLDAIEMLDGKLKLEPTYTAKAFEAMLRIAPTRGFKHVLYWHTLSSADLSKRISDGSIDDLPDAYAEFFQ